MSTTHIKRHINAPRAAVYRALLDPDAIATWRVPTGMRSQVHAFDPREGGHFRVSLTYDLPTESGKTTAQTDTYHGHFVTLVENELIVESLEFETTAPELQGRMTITTSLIEADGGTDLIAMHEGLPAGVLPADNELGWQISLGKLADLVESSQNRAPHH